MCGIPYKLNVLLEGFPGTERHHLYLLLHQNTTAM